MLMMGAPCVQLARWALACRQPQLQRMQEALAAAWCDASRRARTLAAWRALVHKLCAVRHALATGASDLTLIYDCLSFLMSYAFLECSKAQPMSL